MTLKIKKKLLLMVMVLSQSFVFAQVGIKTTSPDNLSVLNIYSTTKGILLPKLAITQETAIFNPANELFDYNMESKKLKFYKCSTKLPNKIETSINMWVKHSNNASDTSKNVNSTLEINVPVKGTLEWNNDATLSSNFASNNTIIINKFGRHRIR